MGLSPKQLTSVNGSRIHKTIDHICTIEAAARAAAKRHGVPASYLIAEELVNSNFGLVIMGDVCRNLDFFAARIAQAHTNSLKLKRDPEAFTRSIFAGGTAFDTEWADKIIRTIRVFKLTMWDIAPRSRATRFRTQRRTRTAHRRSTRKN